MKLDENDLRKLVREILRVKWRGDEYIVRGDIESQIEDLLQRDTEDVKLRSAMKRRVKITRKDAEEEEEIASEIAEMIVNQFEKKLPDEFAEKNQALIQKKMSHLQDLIDGLPAQALNALVDAFFKVFNTGQTQQAFDELFTKPWVAAGKQANSVIPNEGILGSKAFFDVREQGTGDTMGKGEVMLALQYGDAGDPTFRLDPGGIADLTSDSAGPWHVKDLTSSKNISLGKGAQVLVLKEYFPIKLIDAIPGITPMNMGGKKYASQWLQFIEKIVTAMETGDYDPIGLAPGSAALPHPGDSIEDIRNKSQMALDEVIRNSAGPMGPAEGIIFFKGGNAYIAGTDNISYIRGNGRGSNVGISLPEFGADVGDMASIAGDPSMIEGFKSALDLPAGKNLVKRINAIQAPPEEEEVEIEAGEEEVIAESVQNRWQLLAGVKAK